MTYNNQVMQAKDDHRLSGHSQVSNNAESRRFDVWIELSNNYMGTYFTTSKELESELFHRGKNCMGPSYSATGKRVGKLT